MTHDCKTNDHSVRPSTAIIISGCLWLAIFPMQETAWIPIAVSIPVTIRSSRSKEGLYERVAITLIIDSAVYSIMYYAWTSDCSDGMAIFTVILAGALPPASALTSLVGDGKWLRLLIVSSSWMVVLTQTAKHQNRCVDQTQMGWLLDISIIGAISLAMFAIVGMVRKPKGENESIVVVTPKTDLGDAKTDFDEMGEPLRGSINVVGSFVPDEMD